jgi:hypothetical protein
MSELINIVTSCQNKFKENVVMFIMMMILVPIIATTTTATTVQRHTLQLL